VADSEFLKRPAPRPTVDAIVHRPGRGVLLVRRRNPPPGWALPGGFVDPGESCEDAVVRETLEETGLRVVRRRQFHVYSDPGRDPRVFTVGVVFVVEADGEPQAGDDAADARFFPLDALPDAVAFDHRRILEDFRENRYPGPWE
jgi:8-oxo-dGTP diphosphatase